MGATFILYNTTLDNLLFHINHESSMIPLVDNNDKTQDSSQVNKHVAYMSLI